MSACRYNWCCAVAAEGTLEHRAAANSGHGRGSRRSSSSERCQLESILLRESPADQSLRKSSTSADRRGGLAHRKATRLDGSTVVEERQLGTGQSRIDADSGAGGSDRYCGVWAQDADHRDLERDGAASGYIGRQLKV